MRSWHLNIYLDFFVIIFAIFQHNLICSGFQQEINGVSKEKNNWRKFNKGLFLNV